MSLEKQLELNTDAMNRNTAATNRLADLMEKFKPQPCTKKTRAKTVKAEEPKAEEPKAEEPITSVDMDELGTLIGGAAMEIIARRTEEPKAEEPKAEEPKAEEPKAEEPKEVTLSDLREVAKVLLLKGPAAKADAKAAIAKIAGDEAKISTMDAKHYAEVYAALKAQEAKLEEV